MPPLNHALLGASSAARWIACPPSARLTEHIPSSTSPYAAEGTQAHAVCEQVLRAAVTAWATGDGGTHYPIDGLPEDMVKASLIYEDFIQELYAEFETAPGVFIEQRVDFRRWVPEGFGTCDCLLVGDGTLHIIDFKYGMGVPVSPEWNPQMMCYALGALELFRQTDEISRVRMSIVQPRIQTEPETFELTTADLLTWADNTLAPAAQQAWEGKGELNPGEKQCRWCAAYPTCRAWKDKYGPLADFEPQAPALLTDDELGAWLQKVQGLAAYAEALEDYALDQLVNGKSIPGWKAVEGRSTRQWTDQDAAFTAIEATGIKDTLLFKPRERITLTDAEKLLGKKQFTEVCGSFVAKPAGAPKLAPESDKRPSISTTSGFKPQD